MPAGDWRDPFAEDESARERERRREEREARRRERGAKRRESQTAVGDRVKDLLSRDGEPSGSARGPRPAALSSESPREPPAPMAIRMAE